MATWLTDDQIACMLAAAFVYEERPPIVFKLSSGYTPDSLIAHDLVVLVISSAAIPVILDFAGKPVLVERLGLRWLLVGPWETLKRTR